MKANELMLGDYIKIAVANTGYLRVTAIYPDAVVAEDNRGIDDCYPITIMSGIPITPEILEKNRFYYGYTANEEEMCEMLACGYPEKGWCYGEGAGEIKVIFPNETDGGIIRIDDECNDRAIAFVFVKQVFVHELQHALRLCGIEKEIVL